MRGGLFVLAIGLAVGPARAAAPVAPAHVTAESGGDTEVALAWDASPGATGYEVFRSTTQNDTNARKIPVEISANAFHATHLRNDTTYYFRVQAVGPDGTSGFSSEVAATTKITQRALPDGVYTLAPRNAPQLRLQATGRDQHGVAVLALRGDTPAQRWRLTGIDLSTFVLAPESDPAQALTIGTEPLVEGAAAQTAEYVVKPHQHWVLRAGPKGFRLTPARTEGMALTATGTTAGAPVTQAAADGSAAQTWIVLPLPEGGPDGMPDPGAKYVPAGYQLVFGDEFDGDRIDLAKWETLAPYSQPHLNKELENYLPAAVTLRDGLCVLTAEPFESTCILTGKDPAPHCQGVHHWRSGAITSRPTFRHGYYEARIKMPQGVGMWPAFWTTSSKRWPPEWDFLEIQNTVGTLYQYMHPTKAAKLTWKDGAIGRDSVYTTAKGMPNPYDGYVIYGAEVTPQGIKLWINGVLTAEWEVSADTIDPLWVNCELAVGDSWAGNPDETTPQRNEMLIDYLRVYQSPAVEAEVQAMLAAAEPKKP